MIKESNQGGFVAVCDECGWCHTRKTERAAKIALGCHKAHNHDRNGFQYHFNMKSRAKRYIAKRNLVKARRPKGVKLRAI